MSIQLHFKDLDSFQTVGLVSAGYAGAIKNQTACAEVALFHPKVGRVGFTSIAMPHLQILNLNWQTGSEPVSVQGHEQLTRTIGISFHTCGAMHTRFKGISSPLNMKAGRHNLVFTPEPGDVHQFSSNATIAALQVNVDEDYFKFCLGTNDVWAERVLREIEARRPFSAVENSATTTAQMALLIDGIARCEVTGPMRNLMIQSRTLELLSLQLQQFRSTAVVRGSVAPADVEKLVALKAYLDEHFLGDFSLTGLSRKFLLNEFKLKKGFKQLFGFTVFGYIRKLRVEHAQLMLKNTSANVDEVAYTLGYEHSNHFSTAFKNYFGTSPSIYIRGVKR